MPNIPGIPNLDPVSLPQMSPSEAGKPGESISQMGNVGQDDAQLEYSIRKAQEHVDSLAAQNQLAAVYADTQDKLAKTQNSRDVAGVIADSNKTLNDVSYRWSKSPAAMTIQMNADALRPDLARIGTVKQVDLMGKEFNITIKQQAELLAGSYATDRAAGGNGDTAERTFNDAVDGGVKTGLVGTVEADDIKRQFRQRGQELEIRNAISNANPTVNQNIYDTIAKSPEKFPDVTQEQLDTYKGQALSAFEAHTKFQDWAEGEMARNTQLVPKIQQFTNPATGIFDESAAMKDNAARFASGEITETQSKVLAQGFSLHEAQLQIGMKAEANKRLDAIEKDLSNHDFKSASSKLQESQPWFENNGFGDDYRAALHYVDTQEREVRAEEANRRTESRYAYTFARQVAAEQSQDTLGQVQAYITNGGMLTKTDLWNMAGTGKGKMRTQDVNVAWKTMQDYESQPDFAAAVKQLNEAFAIPKDTAANRKAYPERFVPGYDPSQDRKFAQTIELFQQQVNQNPNKSKQEIMNDLLKTKQVEDIKAGANAMFGIKPPTRSQVGDAIRNFFSAPFTAGLKPGMAGYKAPDAAPSRPTGVPANYVWNASGNNGKGSWKAP